VNLPAAISRRLRDEFGFDESVFRGSTIDAVVRRRMEATGLFEAGDYWRWLADSHEEYLAFTDLLLVPESWFFRDQKPFAWLAEWARESWRPRHGSETLRILSVPCASGQEPYSIVITLLEAGFAPQSFCVEAGDLSERFLEEARAGVYRQMAFRAGADGPYGDYFEDAGDGLRRVKEPIRRSVRFRQRNLLAADFMRDAAPFHAVFCRNVLIYFCAESRRRVVGNLFRVLAPDGLLFAGHADALGSISPELRRSGPAGAFCFQRSAAPAPAPPPRPAPRRAPPRPRPSAVRARFDASPPAPASVASAAESRWAQIRGLADGGKLADAETACRALMEASAPTAEGFSVLGEILVGQRRHREAESYFRRAVYLDSSHATSLFYLALMAERRGDTAGAQRFRHRARAAESEREVKA